MILWTIQDEKIYQKMLENGIWKCGSNHKILLPEFKAAYEWMNAQMRKRIGGEPEGVAYPIWAWYQWEGERKRLDMRSHRHYGVPGEKIVLLTVDVPEDKVLLSDFDWWHMVLNDWPINLEDNDKRFSQDEKEESWELIFDINNPQICEDERQSIQATFWELKLGWIKKVETFWSKQIKQ